ncbi:FAS1-like dehydratase domain-containing protein [Azoarcus taiwanensis]|uniref:Acyl-CoA dehydrogenase n=1 Tax=Azoarcus taiwanensis TaxID=666964 RepID=A0A972FMX3_9RHOO|nr:MaoC family dehydratase N-terminal domain-containing protein [Azoarcus taiwanensis]NMG05176.1 acyl-CoA dehydrogenase [Azoarcus taiwanensis]
MKANINELQQWIGRSEEATDHIVPVPVVAMAATLDRETAPSEAGTVLPPLWHWLYFLPVHRHSDLGHDGHARRGGFLPPVPLPRRMWAGSRFEFHQPLCVGDTVQRSSRIEDVTAKSGRSGELVFVKVRHHYSTERGLVIVEDHDIVYREEPSADAPKPVPPKAPTDAAWEVELHPDEVLLFRYSALTFNGHRIHYDWPYVTQVEGYPGLVVHGPLIATLLLEHMQRQLPGVTLAGYQFRAVSPVFNTEPFFVCGRPEADGKTVKLWARGADGALRMEATATLAGG